MWTLLIVDDNVELAGLLAVVAEVHGFAPQIAHTGAEAMAMAGKELPQAALIDLLLPDMQGQEIVRKLAARGVITAAMSGVFRGERVSKELVETGGAKIFFEKPLAARDAMLKLGALLAESRYSGSPPAADGPSALDDLALPDLPLPEKKPLPPATIAATAVPPAPVEAASEPYETLEDLFSEPIELEPEELLSVSPAPEISTAKPEAPVTVPPKNNIDNGPSDTASNAAQPQATPVWTANEPAKPIGPALPRRQRVRNDPYPLEGELSQGSLARLLTTLWLGQRTGELELERNEVLKTIAVRDGLPIYAASSLANERLAHYAVRAGKLDPSKLASLQAEADESNMRTGDAMIALGLVSETALHDLVAAQACEIIWDALDWCEGSYQFSTGVDPQKKLVPLAFSPSQLVLDGFRRAFTLARLRQLIETDKRYLPKADPPYEIDELGLSEQEARLVAHTDGSKSVSDLVLLSEMEERDALAVLVGLAQLGVLDTRAPVVTRSRVVLA